MRHILCKYCSLRFLDSYFFLFCCDLKVVVSVTVCLWVVIMRRGVGVVFCVGRLVEHRHVVIQGHEDILGHDRVQQGVQIDEEGDHLPGEVAAHLEHVAPDHPGVVDLRRVILACQIIKQLIKPNFCLFYFY